jgi:hypothetical protein
MYYIFMQEALGSKNHKRKTIGFSSRVDKECLEILRAEAERQGISVNHIINRILKNYCQHYRWVERFGAIYITRPTISKIVSYCPEDKLEEIAKISGSAGSKDALRTMGISPTYDNLMAFLKTNLGKNGNWFDFTKYTRNRKDIIHLRHELGKNWSIFIANQVSTTIASTLNKKTTSEIFDNYATIEITP